MQNISNPDYEILAEMRGHATADFYRIQIEFVDAHTHDVLYSGLYHIRPEGGEVAAPASTDYQQAPPPEPDRPPVPQSQESNVAQPTTSSGNTAL